MSLLRWTSDLYATIPLYHICNLFMSTFFKTYVVSEVSVSVLVGTWQTVILAFIIKLIVKLS